MRIVDPDVRPQQTVYYVAGVALLALRDLKTPHIDLSTLAHSVRRLSPGTAVDTLIMALDFLFLLGIVKLDEKGGIRCS